MTMSFTTRPYLASILPPSLQKRQMSCWRDESQDVWGRVIALRLRSLMKQPPSTLPELRDITVYHPINADAAHDVEADPTSGRDGQDMKLTGQISRYTSLRSNGRM